MRKDIEIPKAENVYIIAVKEWDKDFTEQQWNVYFVNNRKSNIDTVLVLSRGNSENKKTANLRHNLGDVQAEKAIKIEFIPENILGFTNEYLVTFFADSKMYEQKFTFEPFSISEEKIVALPVIENKGIIAK